ncbi:MAG: hypothetical protein ACOX0X_00910 [Candidatus Dojkabacteria bacterium]
MTNKERVIILSIFVSVFGFALFTAINPLKFSNDAPSAIFSEYISSESFLGEEFNLEDSLRVRDEYVEVEEEGFKMANMLSITLGIPAIEVKEALDGGTKPSEMLASSGILLTDLAEEFGFDIVGERGLVRFRS